MVSGYMHAQNGKARPAGFELSRALNDKDELPVEYTSSSQTSS